MVIPKGDHVPSPGPMPKAVITCHGLLVNP